MYFSLMNKYNHEMNWEIINGMFRKGINEN